MTNNFWTPQFHLFPPQGWMNDPNGLCQFKSVYHAFYQYTPEWPANELRFWGHAVSKDLLSWKTLPIAISPDAACDKDGAFSGSAWIEMHGAGDGDGEATGDGVAAGNGVAADNGVAAGNGVATGEVMRLFYTGNVMDEAHPEADGIDVGREAYQVMLTSEDGQSFSPKYVVLKPNDYPSTCTNHVRDPKVWKQDGALRMLLGAREKDTAAGPVKSADKRCDSGSVLIYDSSDCGESWTLHSVIRGANELGHREAFGYMWECPFLVQLDGHEFLSVCPQGLREDAVTEPSAGASKGSRLNDSANLQESASSEPLDKWQNIWQSGYFPLPEGQKLINVETVSTDSFVLWDHGFDFYAPQTFVDDSGRTILIGWMGIIDPTYHSYPEGIEFCHNLTLPRELSLSGDGVILQHPVKELDAKRRECVEFVADAVVKIDQLSADIEITDISGDGTLTLNDALVLSYSKDTFTLKFIDEDTAAGRTQRSIRLTELSDLRLIVDGSTMEIYLNDGRAVFSTRWFPASERLTLSSTFVAANSRAYSLIA